MRTLHLVVVDDNPAEHALLTSIFERINASPTCTFFTSTAAALAALRQALTENESLPDLMLLDVHLPGQSGLELLNCIKGDLRLRRLPVIMMSTAEDAQEIHACYRAGANAFFVKPVGYDRVVQLYTQLLSFWAQPSLRLPGHPVSGRLTS